jgi:hypothetical protein
MILTEDSAHSCSDHHIIEYEPYVVIKARESVQEDRGLKSRGDSHLIYWAAYVETFFLLRV